MKLLVVAVGLLASAACTLAAYPSTYPYENEAFIPLAVPAGTPNLTYDAETDTGGYIYHYYAKDSFTLTDDDFVSPNNLGQETDLAWCQTQTGAIRYLLVMFGAPPDIPPATWNCTAKESVFADGDFTGTINGKTICASSDCCAGLKGLPKFSDDQLDNHSKHTDKAAAAMCGDLMEEMYCVIVGGDYQTNCAEYYLSPTERLFVFLCPDGYSLYYLSCPVYLQAFAPVYDIFEPPAYYDAISPEEMIGTDAHYFAGDRVCHPYSYYHPESGKASSASSASSQTSSQTSSSSQDDSSAAHLVLSVASLVALAM